jgi:DNA-binding LytR/AlgR family response regulator
MYRCIIIDDEPHALEGLKKYIASMPQLILRASYLDPLVALREISENEAVDLIFLDVDMPKINGIELAKEIKAKTHKLIFTTAHTKYAFEAFEAQADAYLLKPYSIGKFILTIHRIFPEGLVEKKVMPDDFFFVKSKEENLRMTKVKYSDIIAVESRRNDILIHTLNKKVLTYMSLTEINKILQDIPGFVQLNRSFIIKQDQIETINGNQIKLVNGLELTIGEHFRKDFNAFVAKKLLKAGKKV